MAYVEMKCPNCGAPMNGDGNRFICSHCGTAILNVIDAKIDSDVTVMSAQEFTEKLEASKKSFVINVNDRIEEFDVDTMVINKKIKDAEACLANGEYDGVSYALRDVPRDKYFSVERLCYLASMRVKNEFGLTDYAADIGGNKSAWVKQTQYDRTVALADDRTKETYRKIREYCLDKERVKNEIDEINKLFAVGLYDEAVTYAKKMCQSYPQAAHAWQTLYEAKRRLDPNYVGKDEFEKAKSCPDYLGNPATATKAADEKRAAIDADNAERMKKRAKRKSALLRPIIALILITVALLVVFVINAIPLTEFITVRNPDLMTINAGEKHTTSCLLAFISEVVALIVCISKIRSRKQDLDFELRDSLVEFNEKDYIKTFFGNM